MTRFPQAALAVLLAVAGINAHAHTMDDLEASLHQKERYAQFVDRPAPSFNLTDSAGQKVSLADLAGKTVVLNFLYTRCAEACPLHMNLIKQLQTGVEKEGLADEVVFITIATDREEDIAGTHENMHAYGENFALNPDSWRFLYRSESQPANLTPDLAEAYGLVFGDVAEGVQIHGVVTHVIDPTGRMRARFHGLKFNPEHMLTYLKAVAMGPETAADGFWDRLNHQIEDLLKSS